MITCLLKDSDTHARDHIKAVQGSQLSLIGGFNYSDINWESLQAESTISQLFIDCLKDPFLT